MQTWKILCALRARLAFVVLFFSSFVYGYSVWMPVGSVYKPGLPTHIAVTGYSHGQGNQFVQAAVGRLARYRELSPEDNIVLIQPKSDVFSMPGFTKIKSVNEELLGETLIRELLGYSNIVNLDFFSHSSIHQGVGLELAGVNRPDQSFYAQGLVENPVVKFRDGTSGLEKLRKVLSPEAWVTINGCNSGWLQAPALSKILQRPVQAALTGTDFQRLHEDDAYYFNNPGSYPKGKWATENNVAFDSGKTCTNGPCLRMKPQTTAYNGFWGDYQSAGTLGYYKFFCNYENAEKTCYKAMARYLLSALSIRPLKPSSQRADYLEVVYDLLCPMSPSAAPRLDCINTITAKLAAGDEQYSPYKGKSLDCSLNGCKIKGVTCSFQKNGVGVPGTCKITPDSTADGSRTFLREFKNYLRGLDELGVH